MANKNRRRRPPLHDRVEEWLLDGNSDAIRDARREILKAARRTQDANRRARLQTVAASQYLAMLDLPRARNSLEPFIRAEAGAIVVDSDQLRLLDAQSRARILIQIANLMYRHLQFEEGLELAEEALGLIQAMKGSLSSLDYVLDWSEICIWRARLRWRESRNHDLHGDLREVVHALEAAYTPENKRGFRAVSLHLALALELWAAVEWFQGKISQARTKVFRSLALHAEAFDAVRRAYAQYTAGRVEYSHEGSEFTWAEKLFAAAEDIFRELGHPFRGRAAIMRARCLLRQGDDSAIAVAESARLTKSDGRLENDYLNAERELTLAWIWEARGKGREDWEASRNHAQYLVDHQDEIPPRLRAEGYLHRGIARMRLREMCQGPLEDFATSARFAASDGIEKVVIASHLGVAECLLQAAEQAARIAAEEAREARDEAEEATDETREEGDETVERTVTTEAAFRQAASTHYNVAESRMTAVESAFLRSWRLRVAGQLDAPVLLDLRKPWKESKKEFEEKYYMFQVRPGRNVSKILHTTGWAQSTYDELVRKHGPILRPKAKPTPDSGS